MQTSIFDLLMDAGKPLGIRPYGIKAMIALSIEKSYRLIGRELSIEYAAFESGLDRFVQLDKGDFHRPRRARRLEPARLQEPLRRRSRCTASPTPTRAAPSRSISRGRLVGRATNGGYGWRVGKSLALAMVEPALGEIGQELDITILGKPHRATVIAESPFDPSNERLRG